MFENCLIHLDWYCHLDVFICTSCLFACLFYTLFFYEVVQYDIQAVITALKNAGWFRIQKSFYSTWKESCVHGVPILYFLWEVRAKRAKPGMFFHRERVYTSLCTNSRVNLQKFWPYSVARICQDLSWWELVSASFGLVFFFWTYADKVRGIHIHFT